MLPQAEEGQGCMERGLLGAFLPPLLLFLSKFSLLSSSSCQPNTNRQSWCTNKLLEAEAGLPDGPGIRAWPWGSTQLSCFSLLTLAFLFLVSCHHQWPHLLPAPPHCSGACLSTPPPPVLSGPGPGSPWLWGLSPPGCGTTWLPPTSPPWPLPQHHGAPVDTAHPQQHPLPALASTACMLKGAQSYYFHFCAGRPSDVRSRLSVYISGVSVWVRITVHKGERVFFMSPVEARPELV